MEHQALSLDNRLRDVSSTRQDKFILISLPLYHCKCSIDTFVCLWKRSTSKICPLFCIFWLKTRCCCCFNLLCVSGDFMARNWTCRGKKGHFLETIRPLHKRKDQTILPNSACHASHGVLLLFTPFTGPGRTLTLAVRTLAAVDLRLPKHNFTLDKFTSDRFRLQLHFVI